MKIVLSILVFVVSLHITEATAQTKKGTTRTITAMVPNATTNEGKIHFALYTFDSFMKMPEKALAATIKNKKSSVVFTDIAPGEYAIICYHDKNGNNQIDFDERGRPTEDFGVSNNPTLMGPPEFESAKFVVADKDVTLEIKF